jgi:putative exporter of polyketide antibiotics
VLRQLTDVGVRSLTSQPPTLEELFLRHYATEASAMNALVGTRQLVRLAWRRDWIVRPVWVLVIGVIPAATAGTYEMFYPDAAGRASLTATPLLWLAGIAIVALAAGLTGFRRRDIG